MTQPQSGRKKNVKKGIQFCIMVCGASGTGELNQQDSPIDTID